MTDSPVIDGAGPHEDSLPPDVRRSMGGYPDLLGLPELSEASDSDSVY